MRSLETQTLEQVFEKDKSPRSLLPGRVHKNLNQIPKNENLPLSLSTIIQISRAARRDSLDKQDINVIIVIYMKDIKEIIAATEGCEWDQWNIEKNLQKHKVNPFECEDVFFNEPIFELVPLSAEHGEQRYYAVGKTNFGRLLTIVFNLRKNKIRVISARVPNRKERRERNEEIKKSPKI